MKIRFFAAALVAAGLASAQDEAKYQRDFPPEELAARRAFVLDFIGDEAFAIVQGAAQTPGFVVFRQSNELYYLTGIEVAAVLSPARREERGGRSSSSPTGSNDGSGERERRSRPRTRSWSRL